MATFSNIDGEESATVTFTVAAVELTRNSSAELQEILCLGDPDVSTNIARVTPTTPDSTMAGLVVRLVGTPSVIAVGQDSSGGFPILQQRRESPVDSTVHAQVVKIAGGPSSAADCTIRVNQGVRNSTAGESWLVAQASTVWNVQVEKCSSLSTGHVTVDTGSIRVQQSTVGKLLATVYQSTAADLNVTVAGYSTTAQVSSVAGRVATMPLSTLWGSCGGFHFEATSGALLVGPGSTVWQVQAKIQDSSGVGPNIVGTRPTTGAQGVAVRTILNDLQSTCFSTIGNNSTSATVVSSAASVRHKVYAYSITSTAQAINTISFASSLGNPIWQVQMQSITSGITGANLAVSPPAWLFATEAASPLVFKVTGNTGTYHLSFSYFTEA